MEIDITDFVKNNEAAEFSASRMELGTNAGRITWGNAMREAAHKPLLATPEQIEALRDYVKSFGAWDEETIAGWSDDECNAMFIQLISGELRELEHCCTDDGEIDWQKARRQSDAGQIRGGIYPCDVPGHKDVGRIFYYLGE